MQPIAPQKEDLQAASDERNIGARLVHESRRLESALPRSNYEHASIAEGFEVGVRGRVGYERVVESHELWRNPSEVADSGGDDDALDIELLAVLERDAKTGPVCFDESSTTLVDLRARAREERDWPEADFIRDRLAAAGIEVRDEADGGSTWEWYRISDSNR